MSQSALPKLGVISTGAFFVVDLIGVILVSIVTAYLQVYFSVFEQEKKQEEKSK